MSTYDERKEGEEKEIRLRETSFLFGPIAFWFFVICLLIAIWFKLFPLLAVSSFLLLLSVWIYIWKENALKNIQIDIESSNTRLFRGDEFIVTATLKNNKWLPLIWIEWEFLNSDVIRWDKGKRTGYVIRFLWLMSYQKVAWNVTAKALKRGVYPIGEVIIRSGDGFRFVEKEEKFQLNENVYIYPQIIPLHMPTMNPSQQWEAQGIRGGFLEDPLLISGIREYEPGDEWRRFNWHASARTGKMLTNMYEPIVSKQAVVCIDVKGFVIDKGKYTDDTEKQQNYEKKQTEEFEYFLSIIASFVLNFYERGISVGYVSNGLNHVEKKQPYLSPRQQVTDIFDQLAQITQQETKEKSPVIEKLAHHVKHAVPVIIFTKEITQHEEEAYRTSGKKFDLTYYYMNTSIYAHKIHTATPVDQLLEQTVVNER